jgi:hypothetical protein
VVSFRFRPLFCREGDPLRYPVDRKLCGPHNKSGRNGEEKFLTLPGLELRPLRRPSCSRSLYRLSHCGSLVYSVVNLRYRYVMAFPPAMSVEMSSRMHEQGSTQATATTGTYRCEIKRNICQHESVFSKLITCHV